MPYQDARPVCAAPTGNGSGRAAGNGGVTDDACGADRSGAWATGSHDGRGFVQWSGSLLQKRGLEELHRVSERYHACRSTLSEINDEKAEHEVLDRAYWHILRAETSCNFYWSSRWVHRAFDDLEEADRLINSV